ncbi:hypothetical protein PAPYR_13071 [Paratrimastix pyriformis]|uniref:Uncharacterized protein n=1 Tax=Paratrimastix pyriformis TaxID=342808 RepID=A0ABQ8U0V6_9EUKA|nr:hypothetical protein PAPYR_13071 [Paratrimastix pyriformis]
MCSSYRQIGSAKCAPKKTLTLTAIEAPESSKSWSNSLFVVWLDFNCPISESYKSRFTRKITHLQKMAQRFAQMNPGLNLIATTNDVINTTLNAVTVTGGTNPAYNNGYALSLLQRVQFLTNGEQLADVSALGMYMIGCRATPQERSKIFEMWKIGTAGADLQSALTAATPLNIPLYHVAPFYRVENFLIANHLNGKPQYQIDYAPYSRVINAGGGTVSTAPAPSFGSTTIYAVHPRFPEKQLDELQAVNNPQRMFLETVTPTKDGSAYYYILFISGVGVTPPASRCPPLYYRYLQNPCRFPRRQGRNKRTRIGGAARASKGDFLRVTLEIEGVRTLRGTCDTCAERGDGSLGNM